MNSPIEIWASVTLFFFSALGFMPSRPASAQAYATEAPNFSAGLGSSGLGAMLFGGFIALMAIGLLAAATMYFLRRSSMDASDF